jgi:hypothetical protein
MAHINFITTQTLAFIFHVITFYTADKHLITLEIYDLLHPESTTLTLDLTANSLEVRM